VRVFVVFTPLAIREGKWRAKRFGAAGESKPWGWMEGGGVSV